MTPYIVVLITVKDKAQGKRIASALLTKKLIACANMIGPIESMFWWQGKIDHGKEQLLILKTKKILFTKLSKEVKALHCYQTPEIIALPMVAVDRAYSKWIGENVC